jgi:hypothetical protein
MSSTTLTIRRTQMTDTVTYRFKQEGHFGLAQSML